MGKGALIRDIQVKGPSLCLGALLILAFANIVPAQNLGLGTGSRSPSSTDSTDQNQGRNTAVNRPEEASGRKTQMNRRLGLLARKGARLDAKMIEARGREMQGQFYEIGGNVSTSSQWLNSSAESAPLKSNAPSKQWMYWAGAAGVVGVSVGALGFVMMGNSHPSAPPPKELVLTDE